MKIQILSAYAPLCDAYIDGVLTPIEIRGNRGGNLVIYVPSTGVEYELSCPYGGYPNTIEAEVVSQTGSSPSPEPGPEPEPDPEPEPTPSSYTVVIQDSTNGIVEDRQPYSGWTLPMDESDDHYYDQFTIFLSAGYDDMAVVVKISNPGEGEDYYFYPTTVYTTKDGQDVMEYIPCRNLIPENVLAWFEPGSTITIEIVPNG